MKLLNVSDQADVNAFVVHCNTSWSITFEEANVDRTARRRKRSAAQRSMLQANE